MKIYVAHSGSLDYKKLLYTPIRESEINKGNIIVLPHEYDTEPYNSREFLKECDLMVAEVSYPSTGLGIELGWADVYKTPIACIYLKGSKISTSLKVLTSNFIEYENSEELLEKLTTLINKFEIKSSD